MNTNKTKLLNEIKSIILEKIDNEEYLTKFLYPLWYDFFVYVQEFLDKNKKYLEILKKLKKNIDKKLDKKEEILFLEILSILNLLNIYNVKYQIFDFKYVKENYFKSKINKEYSNKLEDISLTLNPIFASNKNITFFDLTKMKNFLIGLIKENELRTKVFTDIVLLEFDQEIRDLFKNSALISSKDEIKLKELSNIKEINKNFSEGKIT